LRYFVYAVEPELARKLARKKMLINGICRIYSHAPTLLMVLLALIYLRKAGRAWILELEEAPNVYNS
jgi:hypothetical protein